MYGVKNTSNVILSIHTNENDAETQKERLGGSPLIVVEDTEANLQALVAEE